MRITTIFWTSIILAAAVLIGWTVINFNRNSIQPVSHNHSEVVLRTENSEFKLKPITENPYDNQPEIPLANEQADLAVADSLIEAQNIQQYDTLRRKWYGKENELSRWVFLDTQAKIIRGSNKEAVLLLQANRFKGEAEIERLVRLAALYVIEDPKLAWKYLSEATEYDPKNPDLHTFKASLSETLNQDHDAISDYIAAIQNDPENPYRREDLADFYLRSRQYRQALGILEDTMSTPSLDSIWLKTLFWSDLTIPIKKTWNEHEVPQGSLKDLVIYIATLPAGIYWDQQTFMTLPYHQIYLNTRQETFWLQLLSALKTGKEETALKLLNENTFSYSSWAPDLEKALKTLINYRLLQKNGATNAIVSHFPKQEKLQNPMQLLKFLAGLSKIEPEQLPSVIPYELQDYLISQEAFCMPFMAVGWTEAALQLHALEKFPPSFPTWIVESLAKGLNQNRDSKTALTFALNQTTSPALSLLIAEFALAADEKQIAFNALKGIYTLNDESGRRAALILGQFLFEHENLADAKKALLAQPTLENDVAAKELLARIALQEGDLKKAHFLYSGLEKESIEAKSFLAQKAFADKEWSKARELTEALLNDYPNNPILKDNLQKIMAEEKKYKVN